MFKKMVLSDPDINLKTKGLYAYFCVMADENGEVELKRKYILEDLAITTKTYDYALTELKEKEIVKVIKTRKRNVEGKNSSGVNIIKINQSLRGEY